MDQPASPGPRTTGGHLVVVGGGIAGLAAAWEASGRGWSVTVVDASTRTGGKLVTTDFLGRPVDEGADAFLRRVPDALRLCEELGIDDLRSPSATSARVWADGRLHPFPPGSVMGVPVDPAALRGDDRDGQPSPSSTACRSTTTSPLHPSSGSASGRRSPTGSWHHSSAGSPRVTPSG